MKPMKPMYYDTATMYKGTLVKLKKQDIIKTGFNHDLYRNILRVRESLGLSTHLQEDNEIPNHELKGKVIIGGKKKMFIQSVHLHWYHGYHEVILYYTEYEHLGEIKHSHGTLHWKNINCHDKFIVDCITKNRKKFTIE